MIASSDPKCRSKHQSDQPYVIGGVCPTTFGIGKTMMGWTQAYMSLEKNLALWKKVEDVAIKTAYAFSVAQIKAGANVLLSHSDLP